MTGGHPASAGDTPFAQGNLTRRRFLALAGLSAASVAVGQAIPVEAGTIHRWSDPDTWGGRLPRRGDVVRISKRVLLDVNARVAGVVINKYGALIFAPDRTVTLTSTGNVVVKGKLVMRPMDGQMIHKLRFVGVRESRFRGGHTMDPLPNDVGLWVMDTGRLDAAGSPKLAWTRVSESVPGGATAVTLAEDPVGWSVGDVLTITPTQSPSVEGFWYAFDTLQVTNITGRTIQLSRPTTHDHPAVTVAPGRTYGAEVLNLTRNVRIEGTTKGRSHIMVMANRAQHISHVAIRNMGPRKKKADGTSVPVLGRYPLHFHMQGSLARGTTVTGVVVRDSGNHAYVVHTSHGITYRDCIAYGIVEDAYWWDLGEATNDLLWERCVAANVKKLDGPDDSRCAGFNIGLGKRNAAIGCVATGIAQKTQSSGFKWREANVWRFEDCLAHNNGEFGIFAWTNDDPNAHRISRFVGYHNRQADIYHGAYSNSYTYEDGILYGSPRAIIIRALAHQPGIHFNRMLCDGAGLADYLVETVEHKSNSGIATTITGCTFRGSNLAAIGWLAVDPDNPEKFDVIDCSFEGNEFWLALNIHPDSFIRVQDPAHGSISLERIGKLGVPTPQWNATVNPIAPL